MVLSQALRALSIFTTLSCLPSYAAAQGDASTACSHLESVLGGRVVLPGGEKYRVASEGNWVQTAWASPTCVIQPVTAEQVSEAVKYLSRENVHFAIRSGGHSPAPLGANINEGVLFDMSGFNEVEYDAERGVATVGTGLRWGEVYHYLEQYNKTVVGGRILEVGVGGLTLGSGLSYLSDLYGLACDNIVLADGSIVNANRHSHRDLWWALKGGANNFGVVTRFTLRTYQIGDVWGGYKVYSFDSLPLLTEAMAKYQSVLVKDPHANLMMQAFPLNGTLGVLLNMVYSKAVEKPAAFAPFYHIPTVADTVKIQPYVDFLAGQMPPSFPRLNWYTTSFKTDAALFRTVEKIVTESPELHTIKNLTAGSIAVGWQPISTNTVGAGLVRGGNALGLEYASQTWLAIDIGWWNPEDDEVANEATASLIAKIEDAAKRRGKYVDYVFMNDADVSQNVIEHYGKGNVAKLRAIQRRYDPRDVFQTLVPGGFKLPVKHK
ncbi:putative FAD-binding oxidoreductase [Poronia punctata]|nr:putative FAD-binding oxidoreductase [Poronia punctata]